MSLGKTIVAALAMALGCGIAQADTRLQGAGATFPNPIYQRWVNDYQKLHSDVKIDYQSIGSGGGIKGLTEKTIDFCGSDAPMSAKEVTAAGQPVVHLPTVAGSVVMAYNLPGVTAEVKLTGPVVADIFMGRVSKWNDPKIAGLNSGMTLPDLAITPAYRTDGSGTNFVFTNYLTTQSEAFKENIGAGKSVKWPVGQGGKGSEGVTAIVQSTPGALAYVELNYASANKIPYALLQNKAGKFVKPTAEAVAAAGQGALAQMDKSLAVNIWNQDGEAAYPIAAFTYVIVYKDLGYLKDAGKAKALVEYLSWATSQDGGQQMAAAMDYAPLSAGVQAKVKQALGELTFEGKAIGR